jgi:DNA-binding transcriptional regulator YdaS (Cro superfamily)
MESERIKTALEDAITACGTQFELARRTGVTQSAISRALQRGTISAELAASIDTATKGAVPKWRFRPDLWPVPKIEA